MEWLTKSMNLESPPRLLLVENEQAIADTQDESA